MITHTIRLTVTPEGMGPQLLEFMVTELGQENIILGLPWLRDMNPKVDWRLGTLKPTKKTSNLYCLNGNHQHQRQWIHAGYLRDHDEELWCLAGYTYSQQLAEQASKGKEVKTFEQMVPGQY